MPLLETGQKIKDTYEVERFLGEGAFAEVYRVRHKYLGRQAMKVFKRNDMTLSEIEGMLGEAILLSRMGHPNIVRVFDANTFESTDQMCGYFTMEYVSGGTLDRYWRSHGSKLVPMMQAIDLIRQVCRGLALAHSEDPPIIHRDIKPQNILVGYETDGLRARISDFGLAKSVNPLTLHATAAGTLSFKAPEAFKTEKSDSCAGDVWSLGVTMYLLMTDKLPYQVDPDLGWENRKAFDKQISSPSEINFEVDKPLEAIVLKCLERRPENRFQNAREVMTALDKWSARVVETPAKKSEQQSLSSKAIYGDESPLNETEGKRMAQSAIKIVKEKGSLSEAADLMEEAFGKVPSLRQKYAEQVRLWRCGIYM